MNLFPEVGQVLLVHDAVHREKWPGVSLRGVDSLADGHNRHTVEFKGLKSSERIRDVSGKSGSVVNQEAVEFADLELCCSHEALEPITARDGCAGDRLIRDDELLNDRPA